MLVKKMSFFYKVLFFFFFNYCQAHVSSYSNTFSPF